MRVPRLQITFMIVAPVPFRLSRYTVAFRQITACHDLGLTLALIAPEIGQTLTHRFAEMRGFEALQPGVALGMVIGCSPTPAFP